MVSIPWTLTGTAAQQAIIRDGFARIHFPFERLKLPGSPELGWRDLNGSDDWWKSTAPKAARLHGDNLHDGDKPDALAHEENGKRFIGGVFFPVSGRIFLDVALQSNVEASHSVLASELAHAVDEFLPFTDKQRNEIIEALHPGGADEHTWWERHSYESEYATLVGEEWMRLFREAYSDISAAGWGGLHHTHPVPLSRIRKIVGIERTDAKPNLVRFGKSKVYHRPEHYPKKTGQTILGLIGLRPCKVCKP